MTDYNEFLRSLRREAGRATLFEPFPTRKITTQLIWRGGDNLWDIPSHRVDTLISLYAYIKSDVAIIEAQSENIEEILSCATMLPDGMRFVIVSNDEYTLECANKDENVCTLASTSQLYAKDFYKPLIYLGSGRAEVEDAISRKVDGVYIHDSAEKMWSEYGSHIAILGGLGNECINDGEPVDIHNRIRALYELTNGAGYMIGSGQDGTLDVNYLGFISMLGIYHNLMKNHRT